MILCRVIVWPVLQSLHRIHVQFGVTRNVNLAHMRSSRAFRQEGSRLWSPYHLCLSLSLPFLLCLFLSLSHACGVCLCPSLSMYTYLSLSLPLSLSLSVCFCLYLSPSLSPSLSLYLYLSRSLSLPLSLFVHPFFLSGILFVVHRWNVSAFYSCWPS